MAADERGLFERVAQVVAPGGVLRRCWSLAGGISALTDALELEQAGLLRRVVVRRYLAATLASDPRVPERECALLNMVRECGVPAQNPLALDSSGRVWPTPYLVLEYVDGAPDFAPNELEGFTHQLAAALARVHEVALRKLDRKLLPAQTLEQALTLALDGARLAAADASFELGRVVEALRAAWPVSHNPPALLHGDFWPGNVIWREGQLVAVIDWEESLIGEPLMDVAIARLDLSCLLGDEAMRAFTLHYQAQMGLDYAALPLCDLLAALRMLRLTGGELTRWSHVYAQVGRPDVTAETLAHAYRRLVRGALAALAA